jgi:hypothetical protein
MMVLLFFTLVLLLHVGVVVLCWSYHFTLVLFLHELVLLFRALVVLLHTLVLLFFTLVLLFCFSGVALHIGVVSSRWFCYFMLVLLFCNSQVPSGLDRVVVIFELVLLLHIGVVLVSLVSLVFPHPPLPYASQSLEH